MDCLLSSAVSGKSLKQGDVDGNRGWPDHSEMAQTGSQPLGSHSGHLCSDFKILETGKKKMAQSIL